MKRDTPAPSFIDISFEEGVNQENAMAKLRYLVLFSFAIEEVFKGSDFSSVTYNYRDLISIIKQAGSSVGDQNYIAYFNHNFIRTSRELVPYSIDGAPSVRRRGFRKIDLAGPYIETYWSGSLSTRWVEHSTFIPIWTATGTLRLSLFTDYRNFINNYRTRGIP